MPPENEDFDMDSAAEEISSSLFPVSDGFEKEEPDPEEDNDQQPEGEESDDYTSDREGESREGDDSEPGEDTQTIRDVPQSWKADMHEKWKSLPVETQDYIIERESQMRQGVDQFRDDASYGKTFKEVMAPFQDIMKQNNMDEGHTVKSLMNAHFMLATADPQKRTEMFHQLARNYGVNLTPSEGDEEKPQVNPEIESLKNELNGLKSYFANQNQQAIKIEQERIDKEVTDFAVKNEFFDEVSDLMIPYLDNGKTLQEAYDLAIWANPGTRAKLTAREKEKTEAEAKAKAKEKAEKARKAKSVNVNGRDTRRSPTGKIGTIEDTLASTYDEIQQRA